MNTNISIRNFCIIAHIDHGKSTLADRFLEITGAVAGAKLRPQTLDTMDLERERGITIKLQPVRMNWQGTQLNLIDTPGHADFSYEVSRTLRAVEGAILLVDATQGVQAQTIANLHLAQAAGLTIIAVINKIDLPSAHPEAVEKEIQTLVGQLRVLRASAKTGEGVEGILDAIVKRVPAPKGDPRRPLRALVFDSFFDPFRGVIAYVRVVDGTLQTGEGVQFVATGTHTNIQEVGYLQVDRKPTDSLHTGEIGYVVTGLKDVRQCRVGDTIAEIRNQKSKIKNSEPITVEPLPGYQEPRPMVFAGLFSPDGEPTKLRTALEKLQLNDAALQFEPYHSPAFGFGFNCGFLGLLHLEISKERLLREYQIDPVITTPSVEYKKVTSNPPSLKLPPSFLELRRAGRWAGKRPLDSARGKHMTSQDTDSDTDNKQQTTNNFPLSEPWVKLEVITPQQHIGAVTELLQDSRGIPKDMHYLGERVILDYEIPLGEIITTFYDRLKSLTQGYGSMGYEFLEYRPGDLLTLDVAIAGEDVEAFRQIVPRSKAGRRARELALRLKDLIPRQLFEVRIQVKIGGTILASESISPLRKDVTAKLYGGDVTRKRKLLEKQKKGKARLKKFGRVEIPADVFVKLLRQS